MLRLLADYAAVCLTLYRQQLHKKSPLLDTDIRRGDKNYSYLYLFSYDLKDDKIILQENEKRKIDRKGRSKNCSEKGLHGGGPSRIDWVGDEGK
ncbi:hypothetical protein HY407_01465 [Candidatus Gottesmanbacteria bacterium]|nr:hypothetical protein [Candidatus Gottesmanbacteria bacterium]